jgi:hypothetical protein
MNQLPKTGSAALLEKLSPHIPDDLINSLFAHKSGPGRRSLFSAAQLFRVSLLALLTPVHSFNLLVDLLPENRSWRTFARLRNRFSVPDVRMLHEFRARFDLTKLRAVNKYLLQPLLEGTARFPKTVALIDSTDLPAATNAYKKTRLAHTPPSGHGSAAVAVKMAIAATMWGIKSIRCDYGCVSMMPPFCWCRWCRGLRLQTGMIRYFWNPA